MIDRVFNIMQSKGADDYTTGPLYIEESKLVRFFLGPNRAVVPKAIDEANRSNLRHATPKTLQKALYVGFFESDRLLQVV
jgi:hypothetical protein